MKNKVLKWIVGCDLLLLMVSASSEPCLTSMILYVISIAFLGLFCYANK